MQGCAGLEVVGVMKGRGPVRRMEDPLTSPSEFAAWFASRRRLIARVPCAIPADFFTAPRILLVEDARAETTSWSSWSSSASEAEDQDSFRRFIARSFWHAVEAHAKAGWMRSYSRLGRASSSGASRSLRKRVLEAREMWRVVSSGSVQAGVLKGGRGGRAVVSAAAAVAAAGTACLFVKGSELCAGPPCLQDLGEENFGLGLDV
jgi:hypothetical protein